MPGPGFSDLGRKGEGKWAVIVAVTSYVKKIYPNSCPEARIPTAILGNPGRFPDF
jgi:hypothetical protein